MVNKGLLTFQTKPSLLQTAVTAGPLEELSPFSKSFDHIYTDERAEQQTNEQGHRQMTEDAVHLLLQKEQLTPEQIDYYLMGDLVNQMTPSNFSASALQIPYIGLFSACATSISSLLTAALLIEANAATYAIAGAASQHNAIERQFRYPVEYGTQKADTAQWTATAAGVALVSTKQKDKPLITKGTIGRVIDMGMTDPLHMGAAMAPAAADTLQRHLTGHQMTPDSYDLIMTGDLGKVGFSIYEQLNEQNGIQKGRQFQDAGIAFYGGDEQFLAGASGAGCSAAIYFSDVYEKLLSGRYQKVLLIATGALLSPLSYQQGETIPCIAHAVELSMKE